MGLIDIEMMSSSFVHHAKILIEEEKISEDIINKSVYKILKLKERIGLFDDPFKNIDPEKVV